MRGMLWGLVLVLLAATLFGANVVLAAPTPQDQADANVAITAPAAGAAVVGVVSIEGTAAGPDFSSYTLEYGAGQAPATWTPIGGDHTAAVTAGTLETWDTTDLPAGAYTLRLQVVHLDGTTASAQVQLTVAATTPATAAAATAASATITTTAEITATVDAATAEPATTEPVVATPMPPVVLGATWSAPINVSDTENGSWFPDLAVDDQGGIHITWCETAPIYREHIEKVFYRSWDGTAWSATNDIVPPSSDIIRHALAIDRSGNLHLLAGGSSYADLSSFTQVHLYAPIAQAASAAAWSAARRVSDASSYAGDLAIDSHNVIHAAFDQQVLSDIEVQGKEFTLSASDIYYRQSQDGGETWSAPVDLFPSSLTGSARVDLEVDRQDTLHVTWDEGWDRLTGEGVAEYSVYRASHDGGLTWSDPFTPTTTITDTALLTCGADDRGGVMLVWRSARTGVLYYRWSADGVTWGDEAQLPGGIYGRPWAQSTYDAYDMAADSAGRIHLALVAGTTPAYDAKLALYHLVWDGQSWSAPEVVYSGDLYPEYPRLEVGLGNQLHLVWFTRQSLFEEERRDVWYSGELLDSPEQGPVAVITPTPPPLPTATPTATSTPTLYPTIVPGTSGLPYQLNTETSLLRNLLLGLLPLLVLLGLVFAVRRLLSNRRH